jgi:hypothetical protein
MTANPVRQIRWIVIHTADTTNRTVDAAEIDKWHSAAPQNYGGCGYHFVILNNHPTKGDGKIESAEMGAPCRPLTKPGVHTAGINATSVAICLVGDGDKEPPTVAQWGALVWLVETLCRRYRLKSEAVIGHREINDLIDRGLVRPNWRTAKTCPGARVNLETLRAELAQRLGETTT